MNNIITKLEQRSQNLKLTKHLALKEYQMKEKERLRKVACELIRRGYYTLNDYYRFCKANDLGMF